MKPRDALSRLQPEIVEFAAFRKIVLSCPELTPKEVEHYLVTRAEALGLDLRDGPIGAANFVGIAVVTSILPPMPELAKLAKLKAYPIQ